MQKTLVKFGLYIGLIVGIHYFAAMQAGAYFDPFYLRFTTGQHTSMILGTSRAAQGILPEVLNQELGDEYTETRNFSFTAANSPYGEIYLKAIQQKLDTTKQDKKNIFILTVDSWSIATKNNPADDVAFYRENNLFLDNMTTIAKAGKPNYEYLRKGYVESWGKILYRPITTKRRMHLHEDGWLEVNVPMNEAEVQRRTATKIDSYQDLLLDFSLSANRLAQLEQTIIYLKKYGEVVLVRLPICADIKLIEDELIPDFDKKMCALSQKHAIPYWSFMNKLSDYRYTDGNHLYKKSARKISVEIATMIRGHRSAMCED